LDLRRKKWREAGEDCIMRSFITCKLELMLLKDQIKEDEMGGAYGTYEREVKCIRYFGWKNWKENATRKT
jgi:hypothetical protein